MKELLRRHHISFKNAFSGLCWSLSTQPNFRIHVFLSATALSFGLYVGVSRLEMIVLVFTVILGFVAEMINTSVEAVTDMITKEWRQEAKIAKDVSAGMMLTVAIAACIIAAIIFAPYIAKLSVR